MNKLHGLTHHPLYSVWYNLKRRCYNKRYSKYKNYGGRGIKVCKRWHDPQNFVDDMLPTFKKDLQIDRIDNNKGYGPSNCRWVTSTQNNRNRRDTIWVKFRGRKQLLIELVDELNIKYTTLHKRYLKGKSLDAPLDQSKIRGRKSIKFLQDSRRTQCESSPLEL